MTSLDDIPDVLALAQLYSVHARMHGAGTPNFKG